MEPMDADTESVGIVDAFTKHSARLEVIEHVLLRGLHDAIASLPGQSEASAWKRCAAVIAEYRWPTEAKREAASNLMELCLRMSERKT